MDILRRVQGVPRYNNASKLFVNTLQENEDILTRKQCSKLKIRIEVSHTRVIKSIFDSCSFKVSELFSK